MTGQRDIESQRKRKTDRKEDRDRGRVEYHGVETEIVSYL